MKNLQRRLKLFSVIAISISAMIGSGIFVLPSIAALLAGESLWLSYVIAGLCVLPAALSKSELATAMPTSGGTYVYIERTFGPFAGTVAGIGLWVSLLLKSSFALVGFGAYLAVFADVNLKLIATIFLVFITLINIMGVSGLSKFTNVIAGVVILLIIGLIAMGQPNIPSHYFLDTLTKNDTSAIMLTAGVVFLSYAGVTKVAAVAEEIVDPGKNLPRGIIISLVVVMLLYAFVSYVLTAHIQPAALEVNYYPIYTLAETLLGSPYSYVYAALGVVAMTSMANTGLMAASRFPFAMSRENLLPGFIGYLSPKFLTPVNAILMSALFMLSVIWLLDLEKIVKLGSVFVIVIFIFVNLSVIVLRETRVQWYKPIYKSHFYPWAQIIGIVLYLWMLSYLGDKIVQAVTFSFVIGGIVYYFYGRHFAKRKGVVEIYGKRSEITDNTFYIDSETRENFTFDDAAVMVALFGPERSPEVLLDIASGLSAGEKIEIVKLREIPQQSILSDFEEGDDVYIRSVGRRLKAVATAKNLEIDYQPMISHDIYRTVYELTFHIHCRWLVKEWGGKRSGGVTFHNQMGWLEEHLACHVATFKDAGIRHFKKIMVLIDLSDKDPAPLMRAVGAIATQHDAHVDFVRMVVGNPNDSGTPGRIDSLKELAKAHVPSFKVQTLVQATADFAPLVEKSITYDLAVMTATAANTRIRRWFGTRQDALIGAMACSVLKVQIFKGHEANKESP